MTDSRAALDMDRLPWLADEGKPRARTNWKALLPWALLAALGLAAVSYWLGMQSVALEDEPLAQELAPRATVKLPQPTVPVPAVVQEVEPAPMPEVEVPAPPPPVRLTRETPRRAAAPRTKEASAAPPEPEAKAEAKADSPPVIQKPRALQYWPASESAGANGRAVRIGTFSSRLQAKRAWWRIVRVYPGMKRMNATVVGAPSLRNGRTYYRLQFGTTSQAHSEILCQRMRIVGQSCVVVGL